MEELKVDKESDNASNEAEGLTAFLLVAGILLLIISCALVLGTTTYLGVAKCFLGFLTAGCLIATALVLAFGIEISRHLEKKQESLVDNRDDGKDHS